MGKALFIDIKEKEISTYLFDIRGNKYEIGEIRKYTISEKFDFSLDIGTGQIENAYISLPLSSLNFRVIELPFSDKDRIREVLPFELDGMILGGTDTVVFDSVIVGTSDDKQQVLAAYIDKKDLRHLLEKLKTYDIDPVFITSLELKNILNDFSMGGLLSPPELEDKDRIELASREIKAPVIDLRRNEFSYTREREKTKKKLRLTAALLALLALVLSADLLLKIVSARSEAALLKNEMRKQYQEVFPGEKNIMNELYQLKSHMKELKSKEDIFIGVDPLRLLLSLSRLEKQGVAFNEITAEKGNITLKGETASLSEVQQIKGKLESVFNEVNISDSKSSAQGRMLFTITAKEKRS